MLLGRSLVAGRAVECDLRLFDEGVAEHQFRIDFREREGFVFTDLSPAGSTRVPGKSPGNSVLYHRDPIECGGVRVRFLCPSFPNPEQTNIELATHSRLVPTPGIRLPTSRRRVSINPKEGLRPAEETGYPTPNLITIFNVIQEVATQADARGMYECLLQAAANLVPTARLVLCRYHEDTESLVPFLHRKSPGDRAGSSISIDSVLLEECCRQGSALADPGGDDLPHRMAVPLEGRDRVHAALYVELTGPQDPRPLLALFAGLSRHAGLLLDQFELVAAIRQRNLLLETLHRETIEASQAHQIEEAKIRALMEAFHDGIALLHESGETLLSNSRGLTLLRKMRKLNLPGGGIFLGSRALSEIMDEAGAGHRTLTDEFAVDDGDVRVEVTIARAPLRWRVVPGGAREPEFGYAFVFRDVTDRRRTEEELRTSQAQLLHSQKMEAIGQLAGGIAHDFNNLLTVILGYAQQVLAGLPADSPIRSGVQEIERSGERASALTQKLLAFSRRQILQPRPLDINQRVTEMERMLRRLIGAPIELRTILAPQPGSVHADAGQLEQVILNLVLNARDAMPDGGMLTVETTTVDAVPEGDPAPERPGPYVLLSVTDTGCGMSAETLGRLFEPFFTTKPVGRGTGLGLSTVYGIVTQTGGTIRVTSKLGRGSRFSVYLPLVAGVDAAPPTPPPAPVVGGSETILVAEDDDGIRALIEISLRELGYTVIAAANGEDALTALRERTRPIHALITDLVMPSLGGRELALRARAHLPELPILFISGHSDSPQDPSSGPDGRTAFLAKPFAMNKLVASLRTLLTHA